MRGMRRPIAIITGALVAVALLAGGCGRDDSPAGATTVGDADNLSAAGPPDAGLPQGSEPVKLDPADFSVEIDNPYWPMSPGRRWVYREIDTVGGRERVVVEVTERTKMIANGIEARVVRDTVTDHGVPVEITDDWFAQDSAGNIWYLGEHVTNYHNGKVVDHAGSFEAGVDGAQSGIALPANPEPGMTYRQEYYEGEAEDEGTVLSIDEQVEVATGRYQDALMTRDTNPLEPKVNEHKFYARGIGPVLTLDISGGTGREELLSFRD
jgi:hypothetical protein